MLQYHKSSIYFHRILLVTKPLFVLSLITHYVLLKLLPFKTWFVHIAFKFLTRQSLPSRPQDRLGSFCNCGGVVLQKKFSMQDIWGIWKLTKVCPWRGFWRRGCYWYQHKTCSLQKVNLKRKRNLHKQSCTTSSLPNP